MARPQGFFLLHYPQSAVLPSRPHLGAGHHIENVQRLPVGQLPTPFPPLAQDRRDPLFGGLL